MKKVLLLIFLFNAILFSSDVQHKSDERKERIKKQIEKEIATEKKYAKEQTFYQKDNYDLKGAEVNKDSIPSVKEIEVDELDMDSVYD